MASPSVASRIFLCYIEVLDGIEFIVFIFKQVCFISHLVVFFFILVIIEIIHVWVLIYGIELIIKSLYTSSSSNSRLLAPNSEVVCLFVSVSALNNIRLTRSMYPIISGFSIYNYSCSLQFSLKFPFILILSIGIRIRKSDQYSVVSIYSHLHAPQSIILSIYDTHHSF